VTESLEVKKGAACLKGQPAGNFHFIRNVWDDNTSKKSVFRENPGPPAALSILHPDSFLDEFWRMF
jgi:hypothetical protein